MTIVELIIRLDKNFKDGSIGFKINQYYQTLSIQKLNNNIHKVNLP